jgi:hypothetical protein
LPLYVCLKPALEHLEPGVTAAFDTDIEPATKEIKSNPVTKKRFIITSLPTFEDISR